MGFWLVMQDSCNYAKCCKTRKKFNNTLYNEQFFKFVKNSKKEISKTDEEKK